MAVIGITGEQVTFRQAVEGYQEHLGLCRCLPEGFHAVGQCVNIGGVVVVLIQHAQ